MTETKVVWNGDIVKEMAAKLAGRSSFEIGLVVEGQAKELAPYDTTRLRGSITTVSGMGQRTTPKEMALASDVIQAPRKPFETFVGTPVKYGPHQEYGTVRMSAQPFLRPALDMARGKASGIVQKGAKAEFGEYLNPKAIFGQDNEAFTE